MVLLFIPCTKSVSIEKEGNWQALTFTQHNCSLFILLFSQMIVLTQYNKWLRYNKTKERNAHAIRFWL